MEILKRLALARVVRGVKGPILGAIAHALRQVPRAAAVARARVLRRSLSETWLIAKHGSRESPCPAVPTSVPAAFERTVDLHPTRLAVRGSVWQPTYAELNAAANRIAGRVLEISERGDRVAVLLEHDAPSIAAVLAVLKAGRILVALNPTYPPARLREIVEDAQPTIIMTDEVLRPVAAEIALPASTILVADHVVSAGTPINPGLDMGLDEAAALVYTSGTTGRPKGVVLTHRWLLRNVGAHTRAMGYSDSDRIPLFGFLSGAQAVTLTCCALLNGATLCPYSLIVNGTTDLPAWLTERDITVYISSASIFRHFLRGVGDGIQFPKIRAVRLSSESATSGDFELFRRHFAADTVFVHTLSSSETGLIAVERRSRDHVFHQERLPIGTVVDDVDLLFIGDDGRPVQPGEVGEIVVRSRHLAAGYWRQPSLTDERFSGTPGEVREFRTGDLGRMNSEGLLEYAGRSDSRVTIRGNRVELADVERAIQRLPEVARVIVEAVPLENHERALVAYVATQGQQAWTSQRLRLALRELVPHHMVPSTFVLLDRFPLTSSGKVDRESLRQPARLRGRAEPSGDEPVRESSEARHAPIQELLLSLWRAALTRQDIGPDDDFFELGGNSLSGVDLLLRTEQALQYRLPLSILMEAPTIRQFEARLERSTVGPSDNVLCVHETGSRPPLFAVCGRYGHALRLVPVLRGLGPDQPCYALQPPAMDWGTVGISTVEAMAAHYLREMTSLQPHGPYRLLGTSFGGLVMFEVALQLQRRGEAVNFLGLVDTSPPTCLLEGGADIGQSRVLDDGPPPHSVDSIEAINRRVADSHLAARRAYTLDTRSADQRFRGELTYLYARGNPVAVGTDRRRLWERFTDAYRLLALPGQHASFHQEPQASTLRAHLEACLAGMAPPGIEPDAVFERSFHVEARGTCEHIVCSTGEEYRVGSAGVQGFIGLLERGAGAIRVAGWAVESCQTRPAQTIVLFKGDRCLGYGGTGAPREDVAAYFGTPTTFHAGFDFFVRDADEVGANDPLRLFVLSPDGTAAEIPPATE